MPNLTTNEKIDRFVAGTTFAVVGASTNRAKYGNKVFRCYLQNQRTAYPVNPRAKEIESHRCYPDLLSLPQKPDGVSIIIPPALGIEVVKQALSAGITQLWFQPGAESREASEFAEANGISVIDDGSCLLVVLGYHDG